MTNQQYKICKYILKNNKLTDVCRKFSLDYIELQDKFNIRAIDFSDFKMDNNTTVSLTDDILDTYENHQRFVRNLYITQVIAIIGAVTGIASLAIDILQLSL